MDFTFFGLTHQFLLVLTSCVKNIPSILNLILETLDINFSPVLQQAEDIFQPVSSMFKKNLDAIPILTQHLLSESKYYRQLLIDFVMVRKHLILPMAITLCSEYICKNITSSITKIAVNFVSKNIDNSIINITSKIIVGIFGTVVFKFLGKYGKLIIKKISDWIIAKIKRYITSFMSDKTKKTCKKLLNSAIVLLKIQKANPDKITAKPATTKKTQAELEKENEALRKEIDELRKENDKLRK
jgi:hypothetical protein